MSLSHQKKHYKVKIECPSCGQLSMEYKKGNSELLDGYKVKSIFRWICENCNEELYDLKAMRKIHNDRVHDKVKIKPVK